MARDVLRQSQVVGLFGPGAMVDLPDRSVIITGLDEWNMKGPQAFRTIDEARLSELLRERLIVDQRWPEDRPLSLRTPPLGNNDPRVKPPNVQARVFPTWFTCDAPDLGNAKRRRMVRWNDLEPGRRREWIDDDSKRQPVTPIRFVCGCKGGHLRDLDWKWLIHGSASCREPMWIEETGTSSEARDTRVRCNCGKSIALDELFIPGRLGTCDGKRPWIDDQASECDDQLRLLTRSATNTYFAQVATVISLPLADDALTRQVEQVKSFIDSVTSAPEIGQARRFNPAIAEALKGYTDAAVFERLVQVKEGLKAASGKDPKVAEFELLASGRALIGDSQPETRLHAETLDRDRWDPRRDLLCAGISALVAVHRLREVSCLYGFTRFEPAPLVDDEIEDIGLAVEGASLGVHNDWLPAIELFGEGLFLHFAPDAIARWLDRAGTKERLDTLGQGARAWRLETKRKLGFRSSGPYMLAHSLAHALMTEIALDCGYPASSLKERIYAFPGAQQGDPVRCGLLIFTASAGTQGTLGGLVEVADRFSTVLKNALEHLRVCSGDPICADHDPSVRNDDRALHGAACHGCLLIAETSCEARNLHLDRALLVDTMATSASGGPLGAAAFHL